ncbi:hypothetical protein LCGC14_2209490 [marine sediment metagenome]|uniref:Uncharacterized protein n=1 Tax=marine sediment metagenome TaxID=412755 RepID=A0A0F9DED8_9ZZZZ
MEIDVKDKGLDQDIELADRVIALIPSGRKASHRLYWIENVCIGYAERFVRDWRVAGTCLERMSCMQISELCEKSDGLLYHGWLKDPRAIMEAYVMEKGYGN